MPSYLPAMQHLKNRDIREKLFRAYISRASSGEFDNTPIILRILQIKLEMAKMLGYENYAQLSLSKKMAENVDNVLKLTEMLRDKSYEVAQAEIKNLNNFAQEQGNSSPLELWDIPYWSERLREKKYEFSEEELRSYFPLPVVLDGLFKLAERLFDVKIEKADGAEEVWNSDVGFFKIFDLVILFYLLFYFNHKSFHLFVSISKKSNEHIASFYLDPYSRPAEKRGGAWMDVIILKMFLKIDFI